MPSKLQILGLILLLVGVVCLAFGEFNLGKVNAVEVERENDVWSHAVNLTRGVTYNVDISASDDWGVRFAEGDFIREMPVNVTITSPEGGVTFLRAFYYGERKTSPLYRIGTPPTVVLVQYQNVDSVGLDADSASAHIRFMARQDGPYNVTVLKESLAGWGTVPPDYIPLPPDYILFYREVTPNKETYSLLATGGGIACTLGGVAYIVPLLRSRNTRRRSHK